MNSEFNGPIEQVAYELLTLLALDELENRGLVKSTPRLNKFFDYSISCIFHSGKPLE